MTPEVKSEEDGNDLGVSYLFILLQGERIRLVVSKVQCSISSALKVSQVTNKLQSNKQNFFQTPIVLLNRTLGTHTSLSPDPAKKAALLCFSTPQLNTKQREMCRKHPTLMTSVAKGAKDAVEECQIQFERRRWNCSAVPESGTLFDPILKRGKTFCHWAT